MELADFISKTLVDIKTGLRKANELLAKEEGKTLGKDAIATFLMPAHFQGGKDGSIDFDVAVTVSQENSGTGGAGIKIAIANLGGELKAIDKQEHISRIKFSFKSSTTTG